MAGRWSSSPCEEYLEVAHEELIRRWDRLQGWVGEDLSGQRTHRRLRTAVAEWSARAPGTRDVSFLFGGAKLGEVDDWLRRLPEDERSKVLNREETEFLKKSRAARDRARRNERLGLAAALMIAGVAVTAAIVAVSNANKATRQEAVALSGQLTANAQNLLDRDPQLSLLLIKKAASIEETEQFFDAVVAYSRAPGRAVLHHTGGVLSAAFSADGQRVVTASDDSTARIWDVLKIMPTRALSQQVLQQDPGRDFTCAERRQYLHEECAEPDVSPAGVPPPATSR